MSRNSKNRENSKNRKMFEMLQARQGRAQTITTLRESKSGKWIFESESAATNKETISQKNLLRDGFLSTVWPGVIMASAMVLGASSQIVMIVGMGMSVLANLTEIIKRQGINNEFTSGMAAASAITNVFGTSFWPTGILVGLATLTGRELPTEKTKKEWARTTVGVFAGTLAGTALAYGAATLDKPAAPQQSDTQQPRSTVQIKSNFTDTAEGLNAVVATKSEDYKVKTTAPTIQP